jgi:hypothetical protein
MSGPATTHNWLEALQRLAPNRFPVVSQSGESGTPQANRIALALPRRFDNALGDNLTDQGGLSGVP